MTVQRKLLLGFGLMLLPVLVVAGEAIRTNAAERRALEALGLGLARTRTFSELEAALQAQVEVVWRGLSGLDPGARREFALARAVVDDREARWRAELRADEGTLPGRIGVVRRELDAVADSLFALVDGGRREEAWRLAQQELRGRVLPALTTVSRATYGELRQSSVRATFADLERILAEERRTLALVLLAAGVAGAAASLVIARGVARPLARLSAAMGAVGSGRLDEGVAVGGNDEVGRLAAAFERMRGNLQQAQHRLVQSEKLASIGEMSAAVAHGLRNPLAGLRASVQLALRQRPDSPAFRETLEGMLTEVDRLDRRISHLLAFSRPAPYHPTLERLGPLVEGVLPAFQERWRAQGITLEAVLPADLPEVRIDPMQVEQAVTELVANATDAMPGGGTLQLTLTLADAAGREEVVLAVADTGRGIPPETLPHVTDPFFTTRSEGTGLGLAIARRFAEQNDGRLSLESAVGRGTTVRLHLPLAPAGAAA